MNRRFKGHAKRVGACLCLWALSVVGWAAQPERPNIVLLFADDMGWNGTGVTGSDYYQTPHLDALSSEGMTFTQAYASGANCVPSRACLISGQYTPRHGLYGNNVRKQEDLEKMRLIPVAPNKSLPLDSVTLAEALQQAGYATGCFGKWQNGKGKANQPGARGFDVVMNEKGEEKIGPDPKGVFTTAEAVGAFMEANQDRPFFAYVSYHAIHRPLQARAETLERFEAEAPGAQHKDPLYAAATYDMDASIGRILRKLDALGLKENTLVLFTSDNGAISASSHEPLRGAKGSYYEGGLRVPMFVRWPGQIEPGSYSSVPVSNIDFYPSFLSVAGAQPPDGKVLDGASLLPLFRGGAALARESLFWHFPGYLPNTVPRGRDPEFRTRPTSVIRKGGWKLHLFHEEWLLDGGADHPAERGAVELYDLEQDPGEFHDLSTSQPGKRDELLADLRSWMEAVDAPFAQVADTGTNADVDTDADADARPLAVAWSILVNRKGKWVCSSEPEVAVPALIESGVQYIRAGGAAGLALDAGIPDAEVAPWLKKLQAAGIQVGVVLFLQNKAVPSERFIEKAQVLKDSGYYDWIMLDGMRKVRPELQEIIDALHAMGWEKIMLNSSAWAHAEGKKRQTAPMPNGIWAYASMFHGLTREVAPATEADALIQADTDFIDRIHREFPGSLAVLKFELPWQMERFEHLAPEKRAELLTAWAKGQREHGYTLIYPFFSGSTPEQDEKGYNAIKSGNWEDWTRLMNQFNQVRILKKQR